MTDWQEVNDFDDRPVLGPPCGVGPDGHTWHLSFNSYAGGDGIGVSLTSGCEECDDAVLSATGGEEVYMSGEISGSLHFEPDCSNLGGWHGLTRCDCGWQWRFDPEQIVREDNQ